MNCESCAGSSMSPASQTSASPSSINCAGCGREVKDSCIDICEKCCDIIAENAPPPLSADEAIAMYSGVHFDGCQCDDCIPFNRWLQNKMEELNERKRTLGVNQVGTPLPLTEKDLLGDEDSFDFEREARSIIENRRNESMERDETAPSVAELREWIDSPF